MRSIVQLLSVNFDPTDTFYPLNLSRVNEIERDIYGHIFTVDSGDNVEQLERNIEEEIVSETGLMVRSFSYNLVDIVA